MSVSSYYRHLRSITGMRGRAVECIALAREAEALDEASRQRKAAERRPDMVSVEVLPDGSNPIRLSRGVLVF